MISKHTHTDTHTHTHNKSEVILTKRTYKEQIKLYMHAKFCMKRHTCKHTYIHKQTHTQANHTDIDLRVCAHENRQAIKDSYTIRYTRTHTGLIHTRPPTYTHEHNSAHRYTQMRKCCRITRIQQRASNLRIRKVLI